ncbi:hypothetical protein MPG59_00300 [Helicobacter pylori]|uniref:hypothetical protein n=1 Tax=Helicobacter pylori TaxID=210 RepID=UPI001FF5500E|nr:hypothetical protein [Helicobacter pylori]MCJ8495272.1 hypothetical protein [Helicobacter pylori]WQW06537.1 hypothetical protein KVK21_00145 [Helicobacter pylori]
MECFWIVFIDCRLFHVDCMWIAWIDLISQQTTIRDYLKSGSYETPLLLPTNFSRLGI